MSKVLICGMLFDATDGQVKTNQAVYVEGNKIVDVISAEGIAFNDDEIIDLSDKFVMPGLIDAHVHIGYAAGKAITERTEAPEVVVTKAVRNARENLKGGFTTVRDMNFPTVTGSPAIRDAINQGWMPGPRIFSCGHAITQTGGHTAITYTQERFGQLVPKPIGTCDSPDEVRTAARTMLKFGADQLKLMVTGGVTSPSGAVGAQNMSYEEIVTAVEVAKMHDCLVSVHAHGTSGILDSAKAGVSSIEHCTMADEECADYMAKNNIVAVPTLIVIQLLANGADKGVAESTVEKAKFLAPLHAKNIRMLYERGIRCVFGTDSGTPLGIHGHQHAEFSYMLNAGISKEDVLLSATRYAAELIRWDDKLGSIETGKLADIIAIDGNPMNDMGVMHRDNISFIMKDGVIYKDKGLFFHI